MLVRWGFLKLSFHSCLRDGVVEETGTHPELLAAGGEYARLYNVQAEAFTTQALA